MGIRQQTIDDYGAFVEKFKPKKTTDDCYTPPAVYETIKDWACREYDIDPSKVVRPFYPGGDYESFDYSDGKVWWIIRRSRFYRRYARSIVTTMFRSSCSRRISRFSPARYAAERT